MDPNLPWKLVKVPLIRGFLGGFNGELLGEFEAEASAKACLYEEWSADTNPDKGISYTYEVARWELP